MYGIAEICLVLLVAALSALEGALILAGILPPISSYSAGNILFLLARAAVVAYAGWKVAKPGVGAALKGAMLAFASSIVMVAAVLAGQIIRKPVFGISVPPSQYALLNSALILALNILASVLLGAIVAVLAAWAAKLLKSGSRSEEKKEEKEVKRKAKRKKA